MCSGILGRGLFLLFFFLALLLLLIALKRFVPTLLKRFGQRVADFSQHLFVYFLQTARTLVGGQRGVLGNLLTDFGVALHNLADFLHLFRAEPQSARLLSAATAPPAALRTF